jgi:Ca-activated chloride channel family protein
VVPSAAIKSATAPRGDFAFAAAVAAFGQVLRGDEMMMGFSHADISALAATQDNFWRQEFLRLNDLAGSMKGG